MKSLPFPSLVFIIVDLLPFAGLAAAPETAAVPVVEETFDYAAAEDFARRWQVADGFSLNNRQGNPDPELAFSGERDARAVWNGPGFAVNVGPRNRILVKADFFDPGFGTRRNVLSLSGKGLAGLFQMGLYNIPGGGSYGVRISGSRFYGNEGWLSHSVERSPGWHRFEAEMAPDGIIARLDLGADGETDSEIRVEGTPAPGDFTLLWLGNPASTTVAPSAADNLFLFLLPASEER